ncbi:MAG: ApaG domain [Alphaproteobacteria bacterium]|nr:ApaG domain [Alphaproteobacteria bacterium]
MLQDNSDYVVAQTGDIMVSGYQEALDIQSPYRRLWAYCLRIENNSDQRIRLLKKDFRITDSNGNNYFEQGYGFHSELPDLEAGECFEFEDTVTIGGETAVLYGSCVAQNENGDEFKIKLPIIQLAVLESDGLSSVN